MHYFVSHNIKSTDTDAVRILASLMLHLGLLHNVIDLRSA